MKRTILTAIAVGFFVAATSYGEEASLSNATKVKIDELPPAAQNSIRAQAGGAEIEDIDKGTLDGRTVYEAAFKKNGEHTELRVAEDGTVVQTKAASTVAAGQTAPNASVGGGVGNPNDPDRGFSHHLSNAKKVTIQEVPLAIRKIIRDHAGTARIEDIDQGTLPNGKIGYQAAYKKNGQNTELRVNEDGTFVREAVNGVTVYVSPKIGEPAGAATPAPGAKNINASSSVDPDLGFTYHLSNSKKVAIREVPLVVREIVRQRAGLAKIEDLDRGTLPNGKIGYQANFQKNGKNTELRVAEDGSFVREVANGVTVYSTTQSQLALTELTNARTTPLTQVPANVMAIAKAKAGSANIQSVVQGTQNGKTVYQFAFNRNGQQSQLRVSEDGTFVRELVGGSKP